MQTTSSSESVSIYDLPPLETGGVLARVGLGFQDFIGASFCLDMLLDESLQEVWCETQDDLTLIWSDSDRTRVEFVQVKSDNLNQLWSVSLLCYRDGKGSGHSILEKSLAFDRCKETCAFRMVTARPVSNELNVLTYAIDSQYRNGEKEQLKKLSDLVAEKVGDFKSANGNDCAFWIENVVWDIRHSEQSVFNDGVLKIRRILEGEGTFIAEDQADELYRRLSRKIWEAGRADYRNGLAAKRIVKSDFIVWFNQEVNKALHPASSGDGTKVQEKMAVASINQDTIESALEQRRYYRQEVLRHEYLSVSDRRLLEMEVLATLHRLKSQLDTGVIADGGPEFHQLCLSKLDELRGSLEMDPPQALLHGCMYSVVDRCLHRFTRPQL